MSASMGLWLRDRRTGLAMSTLPSYAVPVTFFPGALSVMRQPTAKAVVVLTLLWALYGAVLALSLLVLDHLLERHRIGNALGHAVLAVLAAGAATALAEMATAGRAPILVESGVAPDVQA